jgi:hypothetical protein
MLEHSLNAIEATPDHPSANHSGLAEDHGGWGNEQGKKREVWGTFEEEIK